MSEFGRTVFDSLVISSLWLFAPHLDLLALAVVVAVLVIAATVVVSGWAEPIELFAVTLVHSVVRVGASGVSRDIHRLRRSRAPSDWMLPSHA